MSKKMLYPSTSLNCKTKKNEYSPEKWEENFVKLCNFYKLDAKKFDQNDSNTWRALCIKMMDHLVPAFQISQSGNKRINSYESDLELAILCEIEDLTKKGIKQNKKSRMAEVAKISSATVGKVKKAIEHTRKVEKELSPPERDNPSENSKFYSYLVGKAADDRNLRNRKKEKIVPD